MPRLRFVLFFAIMLGCGGALLCAPGCGGDNDPVGPEPEPPAGVTIEGHIVLPAGVTVDAASNSLSLGTGDIEIGASGAFTAQLRDESPHLAILTGPDGAPMLMSWLRPGHTQVSARSTAEALVYFALAIWALPPDAAAPICDLLAAPATDLSALEAAIAEQLAAHPQGFPGENTTIKDALVTTVTGFYAERARLTGEPTPPLPGEKGLLIEPAEQLSGITCLNEGGINKFTLENSYRRRALTMIKKISWFDDAGAEHDFPTTTPEQFEIPPVSGYAGVIGTIGGAVTGDIAYTPVTMPAVQLQNQPGAAATKYWIVTGGLGTIDHEMDVYVTEEQQAQIDWVCLKGVTWDFFIPLAMNVLASLNELGAMDEALDVDEGVSGKLLELMSYIMTNTPQIYQYAVEGNCRLALQEMWAGITTTGDFRANVFAVMREIMIAMHVEPGTIVQSMEKAARFFQVVGWIDIIGGYLDSGVVFTHIAASRNIDAWDVKVTDPAVALMASQSSIFACDRVDSLKAVVPDDTGDGSVDGSAYVYRWSCGGVAGTLINPRNPADHSNAFETSSAKVRYQADSGNDGAEQVKVRVFIRQGEDLTFIGTDSTVIDVQPRLVTITPAQLTLAPEADEELEVAIDPQFTVAVTDSVFFAWTCTGVAGELYSAAGAPAPFATQDPVVRYEAGTDVGEDTLALEAYRVFPDGSQTVFAAVSVPVEVEDFGIVLVAHPDLVAPDGVSFADVMATVRLWAHGDGDEPTGDPVAGRQVTFATDLGTLVGDNPVTTNALGNALIQVTSDDLGTATITATCEGVEESVTVEFARQVELSPAQLHVAADSTRTLTASVDPPFAEGTEVVYRWTSTEAFGSLTGSGGETPPFDSALPTASYTAGTEAGQDHVTVEVLQVVGPGDLVTVGEATTLVTVGGVGMVLVAYPAQLHANDNETTTIAATVRNWQEDDVDVPTGDPVVGEAISFETSGGTLVGANPTFTDAEGRALISLRCASVGTVQVTARHADAGAGTVDVAFVSPNAAVFMAPIGNDIMGICAVWREVPGATEYTLCWDAHGSPSMGPHGICPGPFSTNTGCADTDGDHWADPSHEIPGYKCFTSWAISGSDEDLAGWLALTYACYAHYTFTVVPSFD